MEFNEIKNSFDINEAFLTLQRKKIESETYNILSEKMEKHLNIMNRHTKMIKQRSNIIYYILSLFNLVTITQEELQQVKDEHYYIDHLKSIVFAFGSHHDRYYDNLISMDKILKHYHAYHVDKLMSYDVIELSDLIRQKISDAEKMRRNILKELEKINILSMWGSNYI